MPERIIAVEPYLRTSRPEARVPKQQWKLPAVELPRELLTWETLGSAIAVVLLAQLRLMGELAPFGLVIWAVSARCEVRRMILYALLLLAVMAAGSGSYGALGAGVGMAVFYVLHFHLQRIRLPMAITVAAAVFCSSLLQKVPYLQPYDFILLGLETLLAVLGAAVFVQVYRRSPAELYPTKDLEGIVSWTIFTGLLLLSLVQGQAGLLFIAGGIAKVFILWASFWFGPGLAAAAGAMLGFLMGVQGAGFLWVSVLTFSGFFAGLFRPYGRFAVAGSFLLGTAALSLYVFGWESIRSEMAIAAAAALFFILAPLLPARITPWLPLLKRGSADESEKVRELTALKIQDYGMVFKQLADAFLQAATLDKEEKPTGTTLIEGLTDRVCAKCSGRERCWDKDLQRTYNALLRVLSDLDSKKSLREIRPPDYFQKMCRKKDELMTTIAFLYEMEANGQVWRKRLDENRKVVTTQLTGLSQIMVDLAKEVRKGMPGKEHRIRNQFFHVELGIAQAAKSNQDICGDYYSYLELRDGRQAFILSDGMGNGSRAQKESRAAVQLVEQLLLAGFRRDAVVRTVNTILQLRSRDETFATLDVLLVDTEKGEVEFLKTGAAPSYLRARDKVKEVRCASVPLGILSEVELKMVNSTLDDDTLIVMVTDGILEAAPGQPDWLKTYLARQTHTHPQVLADDIMERACQLYGGNELRDDLTVLVCRAKRLKHKIRDYMTA